MGKISSKLALAGVAAASLALSGCVIIAEKGGDNTRILTIDQIKTDSALTSVRSFSADGAVVQASVWTNCASADSFEVKLSAAAPSEVFAIGMRESATCEGPMRNLDLQWTYETLGLSSGAQIVLQNALVL